MKIKAIENYAVMNQKICDLKPFMFWRDCLSHSRLTIMLEIVENFSWIRFKEFKDSFI